jgi:hypothetical protein
MQFVNISQNQWVIDAGPKGAFRRVPPANMPPSKWSPFAFNPWKPWSRRPDIIAARAMGAAHIDQVAFTGAAAEAVKFFREKDEQVGRIASLSILTEGIEAARSKVRELVDDGEVQVTDKLVELVDWMATHPVREVNPDGSEVWKRRMGGEVIPTPIDATPRLSPADARRVEFVDMLRRPGLKAVQVRVDGDRGATVLVLNAETGRVVDGARFVHKDGLAVGTWRRFLLPGQAWHVIPERPGEPSKPEEPPAPVLRLVERILGAESPWAAPAVGAAA